MCSSPTYVWLALLCDAITQPFFVLIYVAFHPLHRAREMVMSRYVAFYNCHVLIDICRIIVQCH